MKQIIRDLLIEAEDITKSERQFFYAVSSLIGDDEGIDLDLHEISEATGIQDLEEICELLDLMYDLDILEHLDYEEGYFG